MGLEELDRMSPEMREKYIEIVNAIPPARKLAIIMEWCDAMRAAMAAGIRHDNPGISDEDVRREIIKRTLPADLVKKVYGW